MGVRKFYRFISDRYPCVCENVQEEELPEIDNFYLDMNGIIHNCSHPDNAIEPKNEEEIFQDIERYIEVLYKMIKPRKVMFLAIDGVAPRAKMNQQRSRRFESAEKLKEIFKMDIIPEDQFDSNCITPGTVFMDKLQQRLKSFFENRDENWRKCEIILSGHNVPGEGEHKIMDYIRTIKAKENYDDSTRHCLYGLDADLILLGLCTHAQKFVLLREKVSFSKNKQGSNPELLQFELLHVSLLREYLEQEFIDLKSLEDYDLQRIIDDWVLLSFLVGNDFIPNLPELYVSEGALNTLSTAYIKIRPKLDGYLNENGKLNLERFERYIETLCEEIQIEKMKKQEIYYQQQKKMLEKSKLKQERQQQKKMLEKSKLKQERLKQKETEKDDEIDNIENEIETGSSGSGDGELETDKEAKTSIRKELTDKERRETHYKEGLQFEEITTELLENLNRNYLEALQWNLIYYYQGVPSWGWFYPHHFAPYASDLKNFRNFKFTFELGQPLKPFEQLLAVLPPASKFLIPKCYQNLMEEDSPIKKYFPIKLKKYKIVLKKIFMEIIILPMIDEAKLLEAMSPLTTALTDEEMTRNSLGTTVNFTSNFLKNEEIKNESSNNFHHIGFPTMTYLNYITERNNKKIIFKLQNNNFKQEDVKNLAENLINKIVLVNPPNFKEALVSSISTEKQTFILQDKKIIAKETKEKDWTRTNRYIKKFNERGIALFDQNHSLIVRVKEKIGETYVYNEGKMILVKNWNKNEDDYPFESIVVDRSIYKSNEILEKKVEEVFPHGSRCFVMEDPYYGCVGKVIDNKSYLKNNKIKISLHVNSEINLKTLYQKKFCKLEEVEEELNISLNKLKKICGKYKILSTTPKCKKTFHVGLKLTKNEMKNENGNMFLTRNAINIINEYKKKYSKIFIEDLDQGVYENDIMKTISHWINNHPYREKGGKLILEEQIIINIRKDIESCKKNQIEEEKEIEIEMGSLYKNGLKLMDSCNHELLDRVVIIKENYAAPVGSLGTIIAIMLKDDGHHRKNYNSKTGSSYEYEILLDQDFKGGISLHHNLPKSHRMNHFHFINLTTRAT